MTPTDVIREMREKAINHDTPPVGRYETWADALEAAMREPALTLTDGMVAEWSANFRPPPIGTKFYTFPPDAAGEIERLNGLLLRAVEKGEECVEMVKDLLKGKP